MMSLITINFEDILSSDTEVQRRCLDKLVENINETKERTIYNFLKYSGSEDFLWSLVELLSSDDIRLASNAAYVIGSLAETEFGAERLLSITKRKKSCSIIQDLTTMLISDDSETVMNAAGTLGTLAETNEGRTWMLQQNCIDVTISQITDLLSYENNWVASNAALVLARLTISEEGCNEVLSHEQSTYVLTKLILSLGNDSAGRGMNAAFALGRLLDMNPGKKRLLNLPETEKMISTLCRMLSKGDMGSAKNACFALSCLAADKDGNQRVIGNNSFNDVLNRLVLLLANEDDVEAAWFAAMTLRTLTSLQRGVIRLRDNEIVLTALNKNLNKLANSKELNQEIVKTLEHLKRLDAPPPPVVTVVDPTTLQVKWERLVLQSGVNAIYKLYEGSKMVYKGKEAETRLDDLKPNSTYNFKLKVSALGDDSPFSGVASVTTEEGTPSAPCGLRVVGTTPSQIRIAWSPPEHPNGIIKSYSIYLGDKLLDSINETSFIVGRLQPSTSYTLYVRANTSKGPGEPASVEAKTHELGAHAPGRPTVTVIGRNEVHVTWNPPAVPLGRISRYELLANKEVIYSGTDRSFYATSLVPDKEYAFTVCAVTNEGRCESDPTKKRTPKDKTHSEPGRHASKTRSFKAKEFQLEKSKTQSSISLKKPKQASKKPSSIRPSSCSSPSSRLSFDRKSSCSSSQDGGWASNRPTSVSTVSSTTDSPTKSPPVLHHSVVLGASPMKVDVRPTAPYGGNGNLSMFLQKSNTEFPLRLKFTDKVPTNQSKFSIEPISWNDIITYDTPPQANNQVPKKQGLPKPKRKYLNKLEALENEKSFISLITQEARGQRSSLPRMSAIDKLSHERMGAVTSSHPPVMVKKREIRTKRKVKRRSSHSDTSSDEHLAQPKDSATELSRKLEPLTLEDAVTRNRLTVKLAKTDRSYNFDDPKQIVGRLKTPSKGYWSDNDAYSSTKKVNGVLPSNYVAFKSAHRPVKTLRHDSPLVAETWLTDLQTGGDKNRYQFIPTQLRTQPANLPKPVFTGRKLEPFVQQDIQHSAWKQFTKPKRHRNHRDVHPRRPMRSSIIPKRTSTYVVNNESANANSNRIQSHSPTPFKTKYVGEEVRRSPQPVATAAGDQV